MDGWLFVACFLIAGLVPALFRLKLDRRRSMFWALLWLIPWALFLLRPSANYPHPFGIFLFMFVAFGWAIAFIIIYASNSDYKEID